MTSKVQFIVDRMNQSIIDNQQKFKRSYLGASSIGNSCERALQYSFRHCVDSDFDALSLKRFEDGHYSESVYIQRIKNAGFNLQHEEDGKQYGFSALGGWFRGHRDGMFIDLQEFGNAIWEHKSSKKWKTLDNLVEKDESIALSKWNKVYYDQAQLYMGYEGLQWHITTAASEGSREETICLTEFDSSDFRQINDKALRIITSDRLLPKISDNPMFFECKWCDAKGVCHGGKLPAPSCRNCASLDFCTDGDNKAVCALHSAYDENGVRVQEAKWEGSTTPISQYYECHTYLPDLIESGCEPQMVKDNLGFSLQYEMNGVTFKNGKGEGAISSMEMYENQDTKPWLSNAQILRNAFNGQFENWSVKDE